MFNNVAGVTTRLREYGTPQYRTMFYIVIGGVEKYEIRCDPYSLKTEGGIFHPNDLHLRLTNRECYNPQAVINLTEFLYKHGIHIRSISRLDIARDFNTFDDGTNPKDFIKKYLANKIGKLHQGTIAAHGRDTWTERQFNSLKWGSLKSLVTTKLYNKSLEMKTNPKPWIKLQWKAADLNLARQVWRVEFSMKLCKNLLCTETGEILPINVTTIATPERINKLWFILAERYFDFRKIEHTKTGQLIRKSRCKKIDLFKYSPDSYKPVIIPKYLRPAKRKDLILLEACNNYSQDELQPLENRWIAGDMRKVIEETCLP